jgi:site-specific DNA recombinase
MPGANRSHPAAGKAGGYVRLSALPQAYDPFSPDNQRRMIGEAAAREGADLVKEYVDLDLSGRKDIHRPGFEEGIEDLVQQRIEVLFAATVDRFSRRGMGQVGSVLDELERVDGRIVFVKENLDSSKPNSRLVIALLAEQARAEADAISWRLTQWHEHARRMGLWVRISPYGYLVEDHRLKPHPEEAPIVRRVVNEFLDGASLRSIAHRLNDDGIPSPKATVHAAAKAKGHRVKPLHSANWSYNSVRNLLIAPALAALHSHNRQLVYDEKGEPISCGEGIATLGERARILAALEHRSALVRTGKSPSRAGKRTGGGRPAKYLLTSFAFCGHCLSAMNRTMTGQKAGIGPGKVFGPWTVYRCAGKAHGRRCAGSTIPADTLEAEVVSRFTKRLAASGQEDSFLSAVADRWLSQALPESEADRKRLEDARVMVARRIKDLYDDRYERHLYENSEDLTEWQERLNRSRQQRDALDEQLKALGPRPGIDVGALLEGELSGGAWERTPLVRKRDLLRLGVKAVLVFNAKRGQRPLEERFRIVWAHEEMPEAVPNDEVPVDSRAAIRRLVEEEAAGLRPRLTGKQAAAIVGVIGERRAMDLLAQERRRR